MTTPDLTPGRLDELERKYKPQYPAVYIDTKTARTLIAMAKRTSQAERERDSLMEQAGAAGMKVEALASKCTHLEFERDTLRDDRDRLQGLCDWLQEQVFDYQRQLIHCPASAHDDWIAAALAQPTDAGGVE